MKLENSGSPAPLVYIDYSYRSTTKNGSSELQLPLMSREEFLAWVSENPHSPKNLPNNTAHAC